MGSSIEEPLGCDRLKSPVPYLRGTRSAPLTGPDGTLKDPTIQQIFFLASQGFAFGWHPLFFIQ